MSVAMQCVVSWAVGVVAGVTLVIVGCAVQGWEMIQVKAGSTFALIPGDVVLVRRARRG